VTGQRVPKDPLEELHEPDGHGECHHHTDQTAKYSHAPDSFTVSSPARR
jgi:hypothetical protein